MASSSIRRSASKQSPLTLRGSSIAYSNPYYQGSAICFRDLPIKNINSPGRESVASTAKSSSSSSSSVFMMMQEWAPSCFSRVGNKKKETFNGDDDADDVDVGSSPNGGNSSSRMPLRESEIAAANAVQAAVKEVKMQQRVVSSVRGDEVCKEREYIWAHKYRPRFLREFVCNRDQVDELLEMVKKKQFSHFIFEGPTGVGKKSMVSAFLRDTLGLGKLKTKNELRCIELKGEHISSIDVNLRVSAHHVEVNLSELGGYEKHVIVALINESNQSSGKTVDSNYSNSRAIVVHEADKLSSDSQHYVQWIMEKYTGCNKLFFCCYDASKLKTVKHLCKVVKLKQPSDAEIVRVLELIAEKEHIDLPHDLAEKIASCSKSNLRQAIRSFEASWKSNPILKDEDDILTGWEEDIINISKSIVKEQSPKQLYVIRGKLKILIEHNVSPEFIFSNMIIELKKCVPEQCHEKIDTLYNEYNIGDNGPSAIPENSLPSHLQTEDDSVAKFHDQRKYIQYFMKIEEFAAKFMSYYKMVVTKG